MSGIQAALRAATRRLQTHSETPALDAELLLAKALGVDRLFLKTWPHHHLTENQASAFDIDVDARVAGKPIAYLLGKKSFWQQELMVSEAVLVPRPETECLVEAVLAASPTTLAHPVLDLGTGSGAIALALALERPEWTVIAVDKSEAALAVAKKNAATYLRNNQSRIRFYVGDWFEPVKHLAPFSIIVSNPPYLSETDPHLRDATLRQEPRQALVAGPTGLECLTHLIEDARHYLVPSGLLCLEHGHDQQAVLLSLLNRLGFRECRGLSDLSGVPRLVIARI